ncbi:MAG: BON domain-containing protein [Acidobacteriia bacterium]|nr:BON domain-containing protein [Terriglobia bacterium]
MLVVIGLTVALPARGSDRNHPKATSVGLEREVRHQLVMLPYFSVFDDLEFEIRDDNTVVLSGEVTRPTLRSDAVNTVRKLAGVERVVDHIEVLPPSPMDDRIRVALYRAIFSNDQLDRYALRAVPPIHIIVKNGRVTLVGIVATEADKDVAGIIANRMPGIFSVTNDLTVEKRGGTS